MPTVLPISSRQVMPWKNGGGSTTEILVWPPEADLASFAWRISLATIATPGPFSSFPGIDRSLSLVSGAGVDLQVEDGELQQIQLRLDDQMQGQQTHQFRGEAKVHASLVDGTTIDFNVMTRRNLCHHTFERFALQGEKTWQHSAQYSLLFVAAAAPEAFLTCRTGAGASMREQRLGLHDALLLSADDAHEWQLHAEQAVTIFSIHIFMQED